MTTKKGSKGFLFGALAGGIVGSITALLLAPKPGKELRQDISTQAQKVGDKTMKVASQVGNATGRFAKQISGRIRPATDREPLATEEADTEISDVQAVIAGEAADAGETEAAASQEQ